VDQGLEHLKANGIELVNPNGHANLTNMFAAIYALSSSGRARKEYASLLYADVKEKLQLHAAAVASGSGVQAHSGVRDAVTGLLNREAFDRELGSTIGEAADVASPVSLILADVDHFKRVNDTRGHQVGDTVLRAVSDCLDGVCHGKGRVFRFGGEEIAMILPNHTEQEALAVAERARLAVASEPIDGIAVTASFGVATSPPVPANSKDLVGAADRAMYDAKNLGRNLVRLHGEPPPQKTGPREGQRRTPDEVAA
jgi:diguanylate cyclase (GGDEF)-like protein